MVVAIPAVLYFKRVHLKLTVRGFGCVFATIVFVNSMFLCICSVCIWYFCVSLYLQQFYLKSLCVFVFATVLFEIFICVFVFATIVFGNDTGSLPALAFDCRAAASSVDGTLEKKINVSASSGSIQVFKSREAKYC